MIGKNVKLHRSRENWNKDKDKFISETSIHSEEKAVWAAFNLLLEIQVDIFKELKVNKKNKKKVNYNLNPKGNGYRYQCPNITAFDNSLSNMGYFNRAKHLSDLLMTEKVMIKMYYILAKDSLKEHEKVKMVFNHR